MIVGHLKNLIKTLKHSFLLKIKFKNSYKNYKHSNIINRGILTKKVKQFLQKLFKRTQVMK